MLIWRLWSIVELYNWRLFVGSYSAYSSLNIPLIIFEWPISTT
jgi:hypothetical protein